MAKQVAEVVEMLKVLVTKGTGTSRNFGCGKYHFLLKKMTSCQADTYHTYIWLMDGEGA